MSLAIAGKNIENVKIVDDDKNARKSLAFNVDDAGLHPVPEGGPLPNIENFVANTIKEVDAVVCDHRLKLGTYSSFDGAEVVARFYQRQFPVVLCTIYSDADIDTMRLYRRFIPALIPTGDVEPESIVRGFEICIKEFGGNYLPSRRAVQTLVRIEDVDQGQTPHIVYGVVPGWRPQTAVRFPITVVDNSLRQYVKSGERFFAKVNIGAENHEDLFFEDFEYRGKLVDG